jgi:hypothetical protein
MMPTVGRDVIMDAVGDEFNNFFGWQQMSDQSFNV